MSMDSLINHIRSIAVFKVFTRVVRILLAIGFLPSGLKKVLGERFTPSAWKPRLDFSLKPCIVPGFTGISSVSCS